ncbi:hypothetical protein ACFQX6_19475 [Streptosporangium lutulentum]
MLFLIIVVDLTLASTSQSASLLWLAALAMVYTIASRRGLALSLGALALSFAYHVLSAVTAAGLGDWNSHLLVAVLTMTLWIAAGASG